jgi:glucosamine--fructose-6-phosphate aminotransferase (isomerizing)
MTMRSELGESPAVVERLLGEGAGEVAAVAAAMRERQVDVAVVAARGTSDHAAIYAQYILGARNGLLVAPSAPSLYSLYGAPPRLGSAVVIGISQSGRSPDVVSVLEQSRAQGALTVAITNERDSALAGVADHLIELRAGAELAVAATKTYLAEIAVLAMLSSALSDDAESARELRDVPAALSLALGEEPSIARLATEWATEDGCAVIARGFHYATAREWALKLKELAQVLADPYSAADFQHGPIALLEPGFAILAVATSGPALSGMVEQLERYRDGGARLLVLSDVPAVRDLGDGVAVPAVPEWLSPLVAIVPAQLYAYHLARARGLETDTGRNLKKVTLTL